ncbi:unnamed protein product [Cylicocyclus nassatus]|uniref:Globin domain-containing protein n=1 Tax=Cylicocyclus nassatus TaxID=53992 RepID=A0AA36MD59_CYLNA|nr:unnamed protein product [Cylicocyclus nassatus]
MRLGGCLSARNAIFTYQESQSRKMTEERCSTTSKQPTEVTKHTVASLRAAPVGDGHHGRDFYKYFFETHPEHRHFYKGAENYSGKDVLKSERFDKLGDAILLFVHVLANTYENESVFRAFVHRVMIEHFTRNIDPKLWKPFWEFWTGYLNSKGANLSAEQQTAWDILGTRFNEEAQSYLAKVGRDHA